MREPWCCRGQLLHPGEPKGAGQIGSVASGRVGQRCCQTNLDKLVAREANNSRDESRKRDREKFILGARSGG